MKILTLLLSAFIAPTGIALAATWSGNAGGGNGNWNVAGNWDILPTPDDWLFFDTANQVLTTNDFPIDTSLSGITFNPTAGAFVLNGNEILLSGGITNLSANIPTNNLPIVTEGTGARSFDAGQNGMVMAGSLSNSAVSVQIVLQGTNGILSGPLLPPVDLGNMSFSLSNAPAPGTNSWSILGNSVSVISNLTIVGGVFNFGNGSDSPSLSIFKNVSTGTDPIDVGNVTGATGIFNMNSGTLTVSGAGRFNIPNPAGATGIFNQTGGSVVAAGGCPVEFANALTSFGTLNLSGGTFDASAGTFNLALRGTGVVNLSGSGSLIVNLLTFSRVTVDANGATGTLNLNGGLLQASRIVPAGTGAATGQSSVFNFNGGLLRVGASSTIFMAASPAFTVNVQSNGAIIDSSNFNVTVTAPLQHDVNGPDMDGGLTLIGNGVLNLSGANTYTGNTVVSNGTLYVDGSIAGAEADVKGGTLGGIGTVGAPVVVSANGTLSPGDDVTPTATLAFTDSLNLSGTSTMDVTKSGGSFFNDMVIGVTTLTYGGTLNLNITGDPLAAGDAIPLFQFASAEDAFAAIVPATPGDGLVWDTSTLATDGTLRVIAGSNKQPPHFVTTTLSGTNLVFGGTNGVASAPYVLLTSTNVALPLSSWTPVLTNNFDENGNFAVTNAITPGSGSQFYILSQ